MNLYDKAVIEKLSFIALSVEKEKIEETDNIPINVKLHYYDDVIDVFWDVVDTIKQQGFKLYRENKGKLCNPNCIIRVFKSTYMNYLILGAEIYTKHSDGRWYTIVDGEYEKPLTEKCIRRVWLTEEKFCEIQGKFLDTGVKII